MHKESERDIMNRREFINNTGKAGLVFSLGTQWFSKVYGNPKNSLQKKPTSNAPGVFKVFPDKLVSGAKGRLELRYVHGDVPMPAGSSHGVVFEPLSVRDVFFCQPSTDVKLIPYKGAMPKVEIELKDVHGVGFREIIFIFPEGLKPDESFALLIGNDDGNGNIIATVNPVPVKNLTMITYSDLLGNTRPNPFNPRSNMAPWARPAYVEADWLKRKWTKSMPWIDILPSKASRLRLHAPTLIKNGEKFNLRIATTDEFDSRAFPVYQGKVFIKKNKDVKGLVKEIEFGPENKSLRVLDGLRIDKPGIYRIQAALDGSNKVFESNPIVVRGVVDRKVYWGSIHNHGWYSECWGDDLDTFYSFAREVSGFDYVAISDHRSHIPRPGETVSRLLSYRLGKYADSLEAWENTIEKANKYNALDDFKTLVGYEWSATDPFHYNIYLQNPTIENMSDIFTPSFVNFSFVMRQLLKKTDALFIPHTHAGDFPYEMLAEVPNKNGEPLTPCIEIYSDWGCGFHPYGVMNTRNRFGGMNSMKGRSYRWAVENGYELGLLSDSDSHTGLPGRRHTGGISPGHKHPQGITAVWTNDFSRKGIMDSYRHRRTYGTTGEKIFVDVQIDGVSIGQEYFTDKPFQIEATVAGTADIKSVTLYDGLTEIDSKTDIGKKDVVMKFDSCKAKEQKRPYIVEVIQFDGNRAWTTPIWIGRKSIPDLKWQMLDEKLILVNDGYGTAKDILIWHSTNEHPFTIEPIEGKYCGDDQQAGFVWNNRRNLKKTILHYRWHGEPFKAIAQVEGVLSYRVESNYSLLHRGRLKDDGNGNIEFETGKPISSVHAQGIVIVADVDPASVSQVTFKFDKKVKTFIDECIIDAKSVKIPLNGRKTNGSLNSYSIAELKPGQSWQAPFEYGFWSVDPLNKIAERNELDNLYYLKQS